MLFKITTKVKLKQDANDIGLFLKALMKHSDFFACGLKNEFSNVSDLKTTISAESLRTSCINTVIDIDSSCMSEDMISDEIENHTNELFSVDNINKFTLFDEIDSVSVLFHVR